MLKDPANVRLLSNQTEVAGQAMAELDGRTARFNGCRSICNVTIGPNESQTYSLQDGDGVKAEAAARGLTVTEDAEAIQVGNMRFNKSGSPLIASVKYREEAIGTGANGLTVKDAAGHGSRSDDGRECQSRDRQTRTARGCGELLGDRSASTRTSRYPFRSQLKCRTASRG